MTPREYWSELSLGGVTADGVRYGITLEQRLLIVADGEILLLTERDVLQWFHLEDFPSPAMEAMSASRALFGVIMHLSDPREHRFQFNAADIAWVAPARLNSAGNSRVDLRRTLPELASFRGQRVAATVEDVRSDATLLTCSGRTDCGSYAIVFGAEAFE